MEPQSLPSLCLNPDFGQPTSVFRIEKGRMDGWVDNNPFEREEPPRPQLPVSYCSSSLLDVVRSFFTAILGLLSKLTLGKEEWGKKYTKITVVRERAWQVGETEQCLLRQSPLSPSQGEQVYDESGEPGRRSNWPGFVCPVKEFGS